MNCYERNVCNCTFVWLDAFLAVQSDMATEMLLFEMLRLSLFIQLFIYILVCGAFTFC